MAKINRRKRAMQLNQRRNRSEKVRKLKVKLEKGGDKKAILAKIAKVAPSRIAEFK